MFIKETTMTLGQDKSLLDNVFHQVVVMGNSLIDYFILKQRITV